MAKISLNDHSIYLSGEHGPFRCDNCEYYVKSNRCKNRHIISWAKQGKFGLKMADTLAVVEPDGCSDYFEKK